MWHFFPPLFFSQGRISRLVEDLNDERSSADCLMERLDKTKEQAGSHPYSFSFFFWSQILTTATHWQNMQVTVWGPSPQSVFIINRCTAQCSDFPSDLESGWLVCSDRLAWQVLFLLTNVQFVNTVKWDYIFILMLMSRLRPSYPQVMWKKACCRLIIRNDCFSCVSLCFCSPFALP